MNKTSEQLIQKLNDINSNFNTNTNKYFTASTDTLQSKLQIIKKKMNIAVQKNKEEVKFIILDANELYAKIEKTNRDYENEAKNQIEKLRGIQEGFTKRLEIQILERKERENQIIRSFEERATILKKQIQKERKARQALFAQVTSTLEDDLPAIMNELNEAQQNFGAEEQEAVANCEGLLQETQKYVKEFSDEQELNSNKAFELIKDLTKKIKTEIEQEKLACEATHEQVFSYVEETCSKLTEE